MMLRTLRPVVRWPVLVMVLAALGTASINGAVAKDQGRDKAPPSAAPERVSIEALFDESSVAAARPSKHKVPQVPIVIDGVKQEPEAILKFDGQPLYFVLDEQAKQEGTIYVFTTRSQLRAYVETHGLMPDVHTIKPQHNDYGDPRTHFYRNKDYGDKRLSVPAGYGYSNLGDVYWGGWAWQDWSDEISSVRATPLSSATYLFEHENYGGSYFLIFVGEDIPHLGVYGWNDVATSLAVYN